MAFPLNYIIFFSKLRIKAPTSMDEIKNGILVENLSNIFINR